MTNLPRTRPTASGHASTRALASAVPTAGAHPTGGTRSTTHARPTPQHALTPALPPALALTLALTLAGTACGDAAPPALSAAGIEYTESELLGLTADRRLLLGELTAFGVVAADTAWAALGEPLLRARERDRLWQLLQARQVLDSVGAGDDMLEARYRTNPEWELTVRHLLVMSPRYESDEQRADARAKAERALARVTAGEDFPAVAAEVSDEPGAESREGLLNPGREGSWVDEFWQAALALEPGEVSVVVETQYGFHVLRLDDRQPVPFSEARPRVMLEAARMLGALAPSAADAPLPSGFTVALEERSVEEVDLEGGELAKRQLAGVVARWTGGELTADTLLDALATLPYRQWRQLVPAVETPVAGSEDQSRATLLESAVGLESAIENVARAVHAARTATGQGLAVSPAWREAEARRFADRVAEWARMLGFTPGLPPDQIKEASLAALRATRQNASAARDELRSQAGGLLHARHHIARDRIAEATPETPSPETP